MRHKILATLLCMIFALSLTVGSFAADSPSEETPVRPEIEETEKLLEETLEGEDHGTVDATDATQLSSTTQQAETATTVTDESAAVKTADDLKNSTDAEEKAAAETMDTVLSTANSASAGSSTSDILAAVAQATAGNGVTAEAAAEAIAAAVTDALQGTTVSVENMSITSVEYVGISADKLSGNNAGVEVEITSPALQNVTPDTVVVVLQKVGDVWQNVPVKVVNGKLMGTFKSAGPIMILTENQENSGNVVAMASMLLASGRPLEQGSSVAANNGLVTSPQTGNASFEGILLIGAILGAFSLAYSLRRRVEA